MTDVQQTKNLTIKTVEAKTAPAVSKSKKKKAVRQVTHGNAHIQASYNNTIVTITDPNGDVLGWSSAGKVGFKGPKKATPYAASMVIKDVIDKIAKYGVNEIHVFVKFIFLKKINLFPIKYPQ